MSGVRRAQLVAVPLSNGAADFLRDSPEWSGVNAAERFPVFTAADALADDEEVEWIVEKLFSAGSVSMVFGDGGSKKTYCMLDLCSCVATGKKWLGLGVTQSPVLFMDEECGKRRLKRRMRECLKGHAVVATNSVFSACSYAQLSLSSEADIAELGRLIGAQGARLVIIDSWIASTPDIENENDAVKVQAVHQLLRHLADKLRIAIVIVDHTNKSNGYRGSTAKKGGVDCMLKVASKSGTDLITFEIEKARDTEPFKFAARAHFSAGDHFFLSAQAVPGADGLCGSKWVSAVLAFLAENGPCAAPDFVGGIDGLSKPGFRKVISELIKNGKVRRGDGGGRGKRAFYEAI